MDNRGEVREFLMSRRAKVTPEQARLTAVQDLLDRGAVGVVGDLSDVEQTRDVADQVNRVGPVVTSGGYWHHQHREKAHHSAYDQGLQNELVDHLAHVTAEHLT
ncbi:hypothetical protein [Arthrobacter sp. ISL-28]|uniref:hypothetical protein n=1 Tax=Arthrobacter sp. ISL-28 TaxID=2819108 RepID=UPI001BE719C8|nr:hypothetical protein [Arthrobacter sp. ISL-28]MBT2519919.1 hypothetical protein [Arthrobacter sp. ISL-28]